MNKITHVQILDKVVCISHGTNTLWKGMNLTILPQLWINSSVEFNFNMAAGLGVGKF